jgi:hypothetical protein
MFNSVLLNMLANTKIVDPNEERFITKLVISNRRSDHVKRKHLTLNLQKHLLLQLHTYKTSRKQYNEPGIGLSHYDISTN